MGHCANPGQLVRGCFAASPRAYGWLSVCQEAVCIIGADARHAFGLTTTRKTFQKQKEGMHTAQHAEAEADDPPRSGRVRPHARALRPPAATDTMERDRGEAPVRTTVAAELTGANAPSTWGAPCQR